MRLLFAVALASMCFVLPTRASTIDIDLTTITPSSIVGAPCYCGGALGPSYTIQAAAGTTIDFGQVQLNWVLIQPTPDNSGNYQVEYIQSAVDVSFSNSPLTPIVSLGGLGCTLGSAVACGLQPESVDLIFTLPQTADSITIGWFAGTYFAPAVPETSTWAMMIVGFLGLGFMAYRNKTALHLA
jgi:hypothetical protein